MNIGEFRHFRSFGVALIVLMGSLSMSAQSGDADAIQQKLYAQFKLTTITSDRSDIVTPGAVVQLKRDGLQMWSVESPGAASNTYKDGRISQGAAGFGKGLLIASLSPGGLASGGYPVRKFVPGENFWVTGITIQKDGVQFKLYSDPYNGLRFYANLKIAFPTKNQIPPVEQMLAIVDQVLSVVPTEEQAAPAPMQALNQVAALPAAAPVAYQDVAPPPPPPTPAPTLSIGMTRDQVAASFGEPARKAVIGNREIFFYSEMKMKITFTSGIVSDID